MQILKKTPKEAHPYIPELKEQYRQGRVTRREFFRMATLLGMSAANAKFFVGDIWPLRPPVPRWRSSAAGP